MNYIFDEKKGLVATGGDRELLRELIALFEKESVNQLAELSQAIKSQVAVQIRSTAHKIKGSLSAIGSGFACETARTIELRASEETIENARALFARLSEEVSEFLRVATRHFNEAKV